MDAISQALEAMGSTPDQVAETLRQARVRGLRDSTSLMNRVVRYLNRTVNIGGRLEVGAGGTVLRLQPLPLCLLPLAVRPKFSEFLRGFRLVQFVGGKAERKCVRPHELALVPEPRDSPAASAHFGSG